MRNSKPTVWAIDPSHTTVDFAVKHLMIATVKGHMRVVDGTIELDESDLSSSRVEVQLDASSVDTREPKRDEHLRSPDFLAADEHPLITFRSTKVERSGEDGYRVTGDLTIRGTTKPAVLDVSESRQGKDPWGGERIAFDAATRIDRREWGLTWNDVLETGGIAVGNELRISLNVEAVKQAAARAA